MTEANAIALCKKAAARTGKAMYVVYDPSDGDNEPERSYYVYNQETLDTWGASIPDTDIIYMVDRAN